MYGVNLGCELEVVHLAGHTHNFEGFNVQISGVAIPELGVHSHVLVQFDHVEWLGNAGPT